MRGVQQLAAALQIHQCEAQRATAEQCAEAWQPQPHKGLRLFTFAKVWLVLCQIFIHRIYSVMICPQIVLVLHPRTYCIYGNGPGNFLKYPCRELYVISEAPHKQNKLIR